MPRVVNISTLVLFLACQVLNGQFSNMHYDPLNRIATQDYYLAQAVNAIQSAQPDKAIRILKKNRTPSKKYFESFYLYGLAYKQKGDYKKAIHYFSKAAHDNSNSLPAFFERGNCYMAQKLFGQAVFDFNKVIAIDSTFLPAYNNRAYARIRNFGEAVHPTRQLQMARRDLQKVLSLNDNAENEKKHIYYFNLGMLDLYLSEYFAAKQNFDISIANDSSFAKAFYFRGLSNFLRKAYHEAADDFIIAEQLGYTTVNTPEFLKVIDMIKAYYDSLAN